MRITYMLAAESDRSFDDIENLVRGALRQQFGLDANGGSRFYPLDVFPDYVIVQEPNTGLLYRIPYKLSGDAVELDDATEVETAYVPASEACEFVASEAEAASADDTTYPIVIGKVGWAGGSIAGQALPHYYTAEFWQQVAEAANGVPFGRQHPDQRGPDPTGASDPLRVAGTVSGGQFDGTKAMGTIKLFAAESDLRSRLSEARRTKNLGVFGVSFLGTVGGAMGKVDGRDAFVVNKLGQLFSIDLCQRAGAGGHILAAASAMGASVAAAQQAAIKPNSTVSRIRGGGANPGSADRAGRKDHVMNPRLKELLDQLKGKNATKAADMFSRAVVASEADQVKIEAEVLVALAEASAPTQLAAEALAINSARVAEVRRARVENKLTESKLPEPAKKLVRQGLEYAIAAEAELLDATIDTSIAQTREAFAATESVGTIRRASVDLEGRDKLALAMECMFGIKESMGKGVARFRGIKDAYIQTTGDFDLSRLSSGAGFTGHILAAEAVSTADFPNLLLDAMHKRLAQTFAENDLGGLETLYETANLDDFKARNVVRDGYFGELPTVAEAGPYLELGKPTDERVSYVPTKKGGLLTISEETIRNDDLGAIARWPDKLARGGRNTLRSFIVNFFANNPTYGGDGLTLFHLSHNNLLTNAFGLDGLRAGQLALRRQTERDSGEFLGLPLTWIAVPPELEAAAIQLNQTNTAGSSDFYHRFGDNNERIFVVEKFTDTNDWYYGTDSSLAPFIEIGFLDGKTQPEILLANQPTIGTSFTSDQLQYKVKFVYGGTLTDFRGVGKSVVTP